MLVKRAIAIIFAMCLIGPEAVRAEITKQDETNQVSPALQESIARAAEGALGRLGVKIEKAGKEELRIIVRKHISAKTVEEMAKATDAIVLLSVFSDAIKSPKDLEKIGVKSEHLQAVAKELGRFASRRMRPLLEKIKKEVVAPESSSKPKVADKEAKPA